MTEATEHQNDATPALAGEDYDKTAYYNEAIKPLVQEAYRLCHEANIPFFSIANVARETVEVEDGHTFTYTSDSFTNVLPHHHTPDPMVAMVMINSDPGIRDTVLQLVNALLRARHAMAAAEADANTTH